MCLDNTQNSCYVLHEVLVCLLALLSSYTYIVMYYWSKEPTVQSSGGYVATAA